MNILIAGASGFIGKELVKALSADHHVIALGRDQQRLDQCFSSNIEKITWSNLDSYPAAPIDIVFNLSGSNIGAKRWSVTVKQELIQSRTLTNKQLIDWLVRQEAFPHYFCANAIGIYGAHDTSGICFDDDSEVHADSNQDFLKEIGIAWEQSLQPAVDRGIKVTSLRFGVVLKRHEGMLKKLELPFSLGLGSVLGKGTQMISWIYYQDLIHAILFLLKNLEITGSVNITSPHPLTQKEFAQQFAQALHRPLWFYTPEILVKLLFGEMGEYLLLKGQKVLPSRLSKLGFKFVYPDLASALKQEYAN